MNLADLVAMGGVIDATPMPEEIEWIRESDDGEVLSDKFLIHVKRIVYGDVEKLRDVDPKKDRSYAAQLISLGVRLGEKADEQLSYEQAYDLHPTLAGALLGALIKHNPSLSRKKKVPETGSGDMARAGAVRNRRSNNRRGKAKPVAG